MLELPYEETALASVDCIAHTANGLSESVTEKVTGKVVSVFKLSNLPPWVQVGNDADPDERSGGFTENRQNWKHCPNAG